MNSLKIMIILSISSLWWWRKNVIIILLSLEFMLISIFTLMTLNLMNTSNSVFLIMLTIMVAGSSIGLILLISLCRFFKSPNSLPLWSLD